MTQLTVISQTLAQPVIAHVVLDVLLVIAAVIDWRSYRLPNWLTLGGAGLGLAMSVLPQGIGFFESLLGAWTGLVLLLPLYVLGMTGAGDVKLMAMVGAFLGLPDVLLALLFTLIAGGVAAIGFAAWRRKVSRMVLNARDLMQLTALAAIHGQRPELGAISSVGRLPYGLCVCVGTFAWLAWAHVRW
jgi:prepilin peptidase CpaA